MAHRLLLLAASVCAIIPQEVQCITGTVSSDVLAPLHCDPHQPKVFDVFYDGKRIGAYHETLQGLNSFRDRLHFDKETCVLRMKNVSMEDDKKLLKVEIRYNGVTKVLEREFIMNITEMVKPKTEFPTTTTSGENSGKGYWISATYLSILVSCLLTYILYM